MNSKIECFLILGFNQEVTSFTNYYLYDACIDGNISLKFTDADANIILSSLSAKINHLKTIYS